MKPYNTIAATTRAPLFIFGDHTSKYIPPKFDNLGLSGDDLTRHIAWDIGTSAVIDQICAHFGCAGHKAALSRLVADMNREPDHEGLVPKTSDGSVIPANQSLNPEQLSERAQIHKDYHAGLSRALERAAPLDPLVVSIHSFTPHPNTGSARNIQIGLMHKADLQSALMAKVAIKSAAKDLGREINVGLNQPYSGFDLNYTVDAHVIDRGFRHVTFEMRQDLLDTDEKTAFMAQLLIRVLKALL